MKKQNLILFLLILLISQQTLFSKSFGFGKRFHGRYLGCTISLDLYESYLSVYADLKKKSKVRVDTTSTESNLYKMFLRNAFVPGFLLLESAVYPLPSLSAYLESRKPDTFNKFAYKETNFLKIISTGATEPFAFSLFLGEIIPFWDKVKRTKKGKKVQIGSAIMGQVISIGNRYIIDNILFDDYWLEYKWKVKGSRKTQHKLIDFHFQIGFKLHDYDSIYNSIIVGFKRERYNKKHYKFSFIENTNFEYITEIPLQSTGQSNFLKKIFIKHYLSLGKSFPLPWTDKVLPKLNIGFQWFQAKYILPETYPSAKEDFQIFIKPNITF